LTKKKDERGLIEIVLLAASRQASQQVRGNVEYRVFSNRAIARDMGSAATEAESALRSKKESRRSSGDHFPAENSEKKQRRGKKIASFIHKSKQKSELRENTGLIGVCGDRR